MRIWNCSIEKNKRKKKSEKMRKVMKQEHFDFLALALITVVLIVMYEGFFHFETAF